LRELSALFYFKKNYTIETSLSFRILNQLRINYEFLCRAADTNALIRFHTENSKKYLYFRKKIDIYSDSMYAKSTFVETFWCHNVSVPQQAASEMGVGFLQPACRSSLQTTVSGFG
jgi:hypothetical protein